MGRNNKFVFITLEKTDCLIKYARYASSYVANFL